jgi:hypothetical protein
VAYSKFATKKFVVKRNLQAWCHALIMHFHNNKLCLAIGLVIKQVLQCKEMLTIKFDA